MTRLGSVKRVNFKKQGTRASLYIMTCPDIKVIEQRQKISQIYQDGYRVSFSFSVSSYEPPTTGCLRGPFLSVQSSIFGMRTKNLDTIGLPSILTTSSRALLRPPGQNNTP